MLYYYSSALGFFQGLVLAWNMGKNALRVEVDNMCVVKLLQRTDGRYNTASPIVYGILELLSRN